MTISQIECFVESAKTGSFSKAGARLFISQQTVSRQIKALEEECGFPLFERFNLGVSLTEQGELLFEFWEMLLAEHRSVLDKARDMYHGEGKKVRIGVLEYWGQSGNIIEALLRFNERYPDLEVEYETLAMSELYDKLERGKLDLMITFASELEKMNDLHVLNLDEKPMRTGIVFANKHPLAKRKQLELKDIEEFPFACLSSEVSIDYKYRILENFQAQNLLGRIQIKEFHSRQSLKLALITGKCVTVMYENILEGLEDKLLFYPLELEKANSRMVIAWKNDKYTIKARNIAEEFFMKSI